MSTTSQVTITSEVHKKVLIRIITFSLFTWFTWGAATSLAEAFTVLIALRIWKWYRTGGHSFIGTLILEYIVISVLNAVILTCRYCIPGVNEGLAFLSKFFSYGMIGIIIVMIFCYLYSFKLIEKKE